MRVLVDAHMVGAHETGNETYIVNLVCELAKLSDITCAAAVTPGAVLPEKLRQSNLELIPLHPANDWARLVYTLPAISHRWRADILHTTYVSPLFAPCAKVTTVHDVVFKRYPEFFSPRDRLLFATLLPLTLRRVDGVITVSKHAQTEILKVFPYLKKRVYVTLEAASSDLFRSIDDESLFEVIRARYQIRSEFILTVGNLQPRKNMARLVRAFASVRQQQPHLQLVIVGKAQWKSSEIYALVNELSLVDAVVFTGYVPDADLASLYNMARVFVYPSLYEGFGLPVLEAMACGVPVVTSNISSVPEVAGDAALLIDPYQDSQITQAILRILSDPGLASFLSDRGLRRVQQFSWHKMAQETVRVYQTMLDGGAQKYE